MPPGADDRQGRDNTFDAYSEPLVAAIPMTYPAAMPAQDDAYPQAYIDSCRTRVDDQLDAFRKLAVATRKTGAKVPAVLQAFEAFETAFFNNMVIVLDAYFVNRARAIEKKDGNPLHEVRVLAASLMRNDEKLMADGTAPLDPESSVLKYELGNTIRIDEAAFRQLYEAFFTDLEKKFTG